MPRLFGLLALSVLLLSGTASLASAAAKRRLVNTDKKSPSSCVGVAARLLRSAQAGSEAGFEELSRRAAAAVDTKPELAAGLYRQALTLRPSWAEGWFYMGASLYQLNRYVEARDAFEHGVWLTAENGSAWGFLGLCEYELGDYGQALAHLRKGRALGLGDNPQFASVVITRAALLLIRSGAFEQATEQLQQLAQTGDRSPPVIEAYGLSALQMAQLPAQIPAAKQPLVDLAGRAAWEFFARRPTEAANLFQQLVLQYPNQPCVHYDYGVFLRERDPAAALAEFRREAQLNPSHVSAHLQASLLEMKAGNSETGIESARAALKLAPRNYLCHVVLGRAFLSSGQPSKAIGELQEAVKLAPQNPQTHFYLEIAYRRIGQKEEAEKEKTAFNRLKEGERDPLSATPNQ